jgi:putative flippase GtrA
MAFSANVTQGRSPLGRLIPMVRWMLEQRLVRFVIVGGINTLFGYGLFTACYLITHHRQLSMVVGTVLNVLFNYFTTGRLVFANKGFRAMLPFFAAYAVLLPVNMVALEVVVRLGVPTLIAGIILLPPMVLLSYLVNRYGVFARHLRSRD